MAVILGLDPGSRNAGYAVIRWDGKSFTHLEHGTISLNTKKELSVRLLELESKLDEVYKRFPIDECSVEKIFLGKNADSAFKLGHARGICLLVAARHGAKTFEYAPKKVKLSVAGHGGASKDQVRWMSLKSLNIVSEEGHDATDALALALCHAFEETRNEKLREVQL